MKKSFSWHWHDGFCAVHLSLISFVKMILDKPHDETTRLVLADFIGDLGFEACAVHFRLEGYWAIGGATNKRTASLTWWVEECGKSIAEISRPRLPKCGKCRIVPAYSNCQMMNVQETKFCCIQCPK